MLVKPILPTLSVMDADNDNNFSFSVIGGNQFNGYTYEISNNTTLEVILTKDVVSQTPIINIYQGILSNGVEYRLRVKTTDGNEYSDYSDYMIIKCYARASVSINSFTVEDNQNVIKNQTHIFEGSYIQLQNITLKSYYYIIYDSTLNIIQEYPVVYTTEGESLKQLVSVLSNKTYYNVQLICVDQNEIKSSSGIIKFYVDYKPPRIRQIINLINNSANASVDIECDIRQLMFTPVGDVSFIDKEKINLLAEDSYIYMDDCFTLDKDFILQLWVNECKDDILHLVDKTTSIPNSFKLFYNNRDNRFHVIKTIGNIPMEYISVEFDKSSPFSLYIKQENRRVDIIPERLGN